ncbi:MAG: rane protein [Alphaproteobacteria bacterium]|jgi:uncharacterized protein (TIGR00645 family)|nr:rane protein [Alphaproteobacteria bacterium]MDF3033890.1 rane protein [Alphaproteobacteria bacterium]
MRKKISAAEKYLSAIIFSSRWLQSPLYFGLIIAQFIYVYLFLVELWGLAKGVKSLDENYIMLVVLDLIDVVMISNLLVMVIIGGYETFVSKIRSNLDNTSDVPAWLNQVNPNTIKIKVAMSLIGISSIHLLKSFINIKHIPSDQIKWQVIIHLTFLISAVCLAYTAKLSHTHLTSTEDEGPL